MMETDSSFRMRAYYCFVEWPTTYSNLDDYALKLHSDDRDVAFSTLGGAPKIDLPLSKFSLAISVLNSLFSKLTLSAGETNTVVLKEAILGEEKSNPNQFYQKQLFESLASHRALHWKSSPIER